MGIKKDVAFYLLQCKWCHSNFVLCRPCYRGHVYCSDECRAMGRREGKRRCNRQNESSEEGKLDHRERQRKCRDSKRKLKDEESVLLIYRSIGTAAESSAKVGCVTDMVPKDGSAMAVSEAQSGPQLKRGPQNAEPYQFGTVRCCKCGRPGRLVMPYEVKRRFLKERR